MTDLVGRDEATKVDLCEERVVCSGTNWYRHVNGVLGHLCLGGCCELVGRVCAVLAFGCGSQSLFDLLLVPLIRSQCFWEVLTYGKAQWYAVESALVVNGTVVSVVVLFARGITQSPLRRLWVPMVVACCMFACEWG